MQTLRWLLIVCVLCACTLSLTGAQAATPDLRTLNLQLADLPVGFTQGQDSRLDNAAVAEESHVPLAQVVKSGLLLTDEVGFIWFRTNPKGLFAVYGTVAQYDSSNHAHAAYMQQTSAPAPAPSAPDPWHGLVTANHAVISPAFKGVGRQHSVWTWAAKVPVKNSISIINIADHCLFYRGNYLVDIITLSVSTHDLTQLSQLARTVDRRIKDAK